jgi:hypothetical protein
MEEPLIGKLYQPYSLPHGEIVTNISITLVVFEFLDSSIQGIPYPLIPNTSNTSTGWRLPFTDNGLTGRAIIFVATCR